VIGIIFKTLQKAIKIYPKVAKRIKPMTRMADFEIWGEAISQSLHNSENKFLEAYVKKLDEDFLNAKDQYIVAQIIDEMMQKNDHIEETVQSLHHVIKTMALEKDLPIENRFVHFPKLPNQLSKELKVIGPILTRLGYKVTLNQYTSRDGKFPRNSMIVDISKRKIPQKLDIFVPKNKTKPKRKPKSPAKDGKDDKNESQTSEKPFFKCLTCDAGPFGIMDNSPSGNILKFHKNIKHKIQYFTKKELSVLDSKKNLFNK
jgi:hypothetical protein